MSTLNLYNTIPQTIDSYLNPVAAGAPNVSHSDPTTTASYFIGPSLTGFGFTYDGIGRLSGGTITSISFSLGATGSMPGANETASGLSIPVTTLLQYFANRQSIVPLLFGASNIIDVNTNDAYSTSGDNIFNVTGAGVYAYQYPFPGTPVVDHTAVTIDGTGGSDTAIFSADPYANDLRSDAALSGGGGNEMMYLHSPAGSVVLTASMIQIDTLQFVDGSVYEDNAAPGAQAALMFEGIFGRLPDAVNAGGFALVANQAGQVAAASQMLATAEGGADTAGLSTSQFVTRLYNDMLHRAPDAAGAAGWQQDIDSGQLSRAGVVSRFAASLEAQQVNFAAFATGSVFAADPNAVEVLRAYALLLNRAPEAVSLAADTRLLDAGASLQSLYGAVQSSAEFASDGPNRYGITAATPYATVYAAAHSDPFNGAITAMVTSQGVAHLA